MLSASFESRCRSVRRILPPPIKDLDPDHPLGLSEVFEASRALNLENENEMHRLDLS